MEENKLIIYPKGCFGDKNNNIQLKSNNITLFNNLLKIFHGITSQFYLNIKEEYKKFIPLNLFLQGHSENWIMIESWSFNDNLFLEFCEYCAKELKIPFEFCK